jgi:tRNA nucleotidyltransferase (CCA-adding enzyme)
VAAPALEACAPLAGSTSCASPGWYALLIEALVGCPQDPHGTRRRPDPRSHALDLRRRAAQARDDLVVGFAVLCHDLGKPATTREEAGRITSHGHEPLGAELCRHFLARLTDERDLADEVAPLVAANLVPAQLHRQAAGDAAIRRLARRVGRIDRLVRVAAADHAGRPPRQEPFEAGAWLLARARALEVESAAPRPLVIGRQRVALGREPGPDFEPISRLLRRSSRERSQRGGGVAYRAACWLVARRA